MTPAPSPSTPAAGTPTTGYNPQLLAALTQPGYLGGVATYNPASYNPSTYKASTYQGAQVGFDPLMQSLLQSLSPQSTIGQLQQSMVPQTQAAFQGLNQQLADFGVQGGQAIQAGQQLGGQLEGSIAPAMAAAIQNAQANSLNAGEFNSSNALQAAMANQQSVDAARAADMAAKNQARQFDAGAFNAAGQFNAGEANAANQYNANQYNAMNQYNTGLQNQYQQEILNAILGNYGQQMGAAQGFIGAGQQGLTQQGLNYGQQVTQNPGLFNDLLGAFSVAAPFLGA